MLSPLSSRSSSRRSTRGFIALSAAVAAILAGRASAASIVLNNGDTQTYTPAAIGVSGAVDTRTFSGQGVNDASLVNFLGAANSVGTSSTLGLASQPTTTATQFLGSLNVTAPGSYTFGLSSDDGSRLYIDGILVVNNEGPHGVTNFTNSITLDAGRHEIRVEYVNNTGGSGLTVTYSGLDQPASGVIPSTNLFRAENFAAVSTTTAPHTTTALGDDITLAADASATIALQGTAYANAGLNSLSFGGGGTLNVSGTANRDLRFGTTTFNGSGTYTVNSAADVSLGVASGTAAGSAIVKQGTGRLILDNSSATANDFTGTTFDVQNGTLSVVGRNVSGATNPLGTASVSLNGGTLSLDTNAGDLTYNNPIALAGAGGTIQAVTGPRNMTLTSPINIGEGQTLTLNTLGGSTLVAGANLILGSALTGSGNLAVTHTSASNGSNKGLSVLAADNLGFSGAITLSGGNLEARMATASSKPLGTNPTITINNGGLFLKGGSTTANLTYNVGTNVLASGTAALDANLYGTGAQGGTVVLGTLTTSAGTTLKASAGNGYSLSFANTVLGGATTFEINSGTLSPGPVTGGVALSKTGAGTLNLGPANDFVGTSNLVGGVVVAPVYADSGPGSIGTGRIDFSGGTLRYTGSANIVTNRTFAATTTIGGAGLDISQAGTTFEITSTFAGNTATALTKSGPGTLILSGNTDNNSLILNAQAGLTQLNKGNGAGVRAVAGISNIAAGATVQLNGTGTDQIYGGSTTGNTAGVTMSGGTLDLNGRNEGFDRLNGSGTVINNGAAGSTSVLTLGEAGGSGTFSGSIKDGINGGKVGITKVGAGVATIGAATAGSNTYSGTTTISGGTLRIGAAPSAPVAGSGLWLDAADAGSVVLNGSTVSQWSDKSGNSRNATQTTAANQPNYTTNAIVGGKGVIDFAGSQKFLNVDLSFLEGTSYTIFAVEGKESTAANNYYIGSRGGATNQALHVGYRSDTTVTLAQYSNDTTTGTNASYAYTGTQVFRLWTSSLNTTVGQSILLNGVQQALDTNKKGALAESTNGVIGQGINTTMQYTGDIAEILVYSSALSTTDRQTVEAYLNAKWFGVGATSNILPASTAMNITASGATLDLAGSNQTVGSLAGVAGSAVTLGAGKLTVSGANSTIFAGNITSSGAPTVSLVKQGAGTLTLAGNNTHAGATRVEAGTLLVTGSITGATVIDGPMAILAGTGTIGATTLTNGTLTAGDASLASLATGDLTLGGGTALFELASNGSSDVLNVGGTVNFTAPVQLSLSFNSDLPDLLSFTLIANDGGDGFGFGGGGLFAGAAAITPGTPFSFTSGGFTEFFEASFTGGDGNDLTLTVVPEPASVMTLLGGIGALAAMRRRRRG